MDDIRILTVTTAASTQDLTTVAAVKADLGIVNGDFDTRLLGYIHEQSVVIADYCDRIFGRETVTETFTLSVPREALTLKRWPSITFTSIVEDGDTLVAADWRLDDAAGELYRMDGDGGFAEWPSAVDIVLTYTAGYDLLDGLPRPIEAVCRALVKAQWFASRRDPYVRSEDVPGVYRADYWVGDLPGGPGIMAPLDPYRNKVL